MTEVIKAGTSVASSSDEHATSADTVTIMVGSFLNMDQMVPSGVVPSLVANGAIGLDVLDYDMADTTYRSTYGSDLVTQLAGAWSGSGSGTQEMSEYAGISAGTLALTNTAGGTIAIAAQGALFTATDGRTYETEEQPTNPAWSNGTRQTGSGNYVIAPGQTISVPVEATFQGDDAASDAAGSITRSAVPGLDVAQTAALSPGSAYTNPDDNDESGWLTNDLGSYGFVFTHQGLAPAEAHVNVNAAISWTATDVASWEGYVANARAVGILNVAPLESGTIPEEDPTQPFATSAFYAGLRSAALYGGGLEIELPSYYWFHLTPSEQQTVVEEIRWCNAEGIRSSLLVNNQTDYAGDPDPAFATDTVAMLRQLQAEDALPGQVVFENDNSTSVGSYYGAGDPNALNAVALDVAAAFNFTPSASEDGLEVRGTSAAQTTLLMSGVQPGEDLAGGSLAPYSGARIFSEAPAATLTLTVSDTTGLLALADSLDGASGGTLIFTGTAADATAFLADLTATAAPGAIGVADLALTLTDDLGQTTEGLTAVSVGHVHPVFTAVDAAGAGATVHTGGVVTFSLATSAPVTVAGTPTLVLTNERMATYAGQDGAGNLLFRYAVAAGDDTAALRVRGLRLDGASITDSTTGLAIDPDSIDGPATAMVDALAVDTKTDTITGVTATGSASGTLGAGDEATFLLTAGSPIATVNGTPTLTLNDGGTATYAGLTRAGALEFTYAIPGGGAVAALAPSSSGLSGASFTNALGEPVDVPAVLPAPSRAISYDATDTGGDPDTLVIALSADEYLGDATAVITVNGRAVGAAIDVAAVHAAGQTQLVTITGDFGTAIDQLGISYTDDLWRGTTATDRNLYVDGVTLNGVSELGRTELETTSTLAVPLVPVAADRLQLWVNEDAAAGNAMFSVTVDGERLPGTYSTDVAHASGVWQEVDISGHFGAGPHTVTATFLNDAWSNTLDRNLYVSRIAIDGVTATPATQALLATGSSATVSVPAPVEDVLTLAVSEDAWNGDAQCYVTIDGKPFGGITTVTASHAAGAVQTITIDAPGLRTGTHTIGLAFINDADSGLPGQDRNLYLDAARLNGVDQGVAAAVTAAGTAFFQVGQPAAAGVTVEGAASLLGGLSTSTTSWPLPAALANGVAIGGLHVSQGAPGAAAVLLGNPA